MKQGFVKVAAATPKIAVADCKKNVEVILESIREMEEKGAKVMVLPELCITGYTCADLFWQGRLLEEARQKDCRAMNGLTKKTLETTKRYRDFKAAGTKGITGCNIRSVILPLLADHVLREANHYLRILKQERV